MSTDRIVLVDRNTGAIKLSEGDESPWARDHRMYDRPITLAGLARHYPDLYDWYIVALQRFKENPTMNSSDWVCFEGDQ
jgi:hypothetical protein